jgi:hypothetical protein
MIKSLACLIIAHFFLPVLGYSQKLFKTIQSGTSDSIYYSDKTGLVGGKKFNSKRKEVSIGYWIDQRHDSVQFWMIWTNPKKEDINIRKGDTLQFRLQDGSIVNLRASQNVDLLTNHIHSFVNAPYLVNQAEGAALKKAPALLLRVFHAEGVWHYEIDQEARSSVQKCIALFNY